MPVDRNAVGARGEAIVTNLLTRRHGRDTSLFQPQFLGDKYPTIDFFVELVGSTGAQTPFFLVQVKATSTGYTRSNRLKAQVRRDDMAGLRRYPVPVYVVGVDEVDEVAYLTAAVAAAPQQFSSLPTMHRLATFETLQSLHEEVDQLWRDQDIQFVRSRFAAPLERRNRNGV